MLQQNKLLDTQGTSKQNKCPCCGFTTGSGSRPRGIEMAKSNAVWRLAALHISNLADAGRPSLPGSAGSGASRSGCNGARQGREEQPVLFAVPD